MKISGFLFQSDLYHTPNNKGEFALEDEYRKKYRLKFLQYLAESKLKYESISCLCGADEFEVLTTVDRYNIPQITSLCKQCGLMLNNPRLDEESIHLMYSSDLYRGLSEGEDAFKDAEIPIQGGYDQTILEFLKENNLNFSGKTKVLDVGCYTGKTLYGLKKHGWEVSGIEPDERACKIGNKYDLNIRCGNIEDLTGTNDFDLIIMTEVFEHLMDSSRALEKIATFLKPEGVIYISVIGLLRPGWVNLKRFTQVAHPYNFSLNTLSMVLGAHGFSLIAGNEKIQALFMKSSSAPGQYVTNKNNYESIRKKFVELDRGYQKLSYRLKNTLKTFAKEIIQIFFK